jgi:hypothetical protein
MRNVSGYVALAHWKNTFAGLMFGRIMSNRHYTLDDFEAAIRIYSSEEGGRKPPAFNGIRWDFAYAIEPDAIELYGIYPDFCDSQGRSLPTDQPLPVGIELPARMLICSEHVRESQRGRIAPGTRFYCHEGPKRVAEGVVTRITGLAGIQSGPDE